MVKPVSKAEISSFVKGIITEASALNFPSDASIDEQNFLLNKDGSRKRRDGVDFEEDYVKIVTNQVSWYDPTFETSTYRWANAGNDPANDFSVVQIGNRVDIFNNTYKSISSHYLYSILLDSFDGYSRVSYATVEGMLVIACGTPNIHILKYNDGVFEYTQDRLLVRDLWGLPDRTGQELDVRPTVVEINHIYNLRNQGWDIPRKNKDGALDDPLKIFYDYHQEFPSNAEVVWTGLQMQSVVNGDPFERIYPEMYDDVRGLDFPAAKGSFIIDALERGKSRINQYNALHDKYPAELTYQVVLTNNDKTPNGATVVKEFAGRVFYGGFSGDIIDEIDTSPVMSNYILFSQLIKERGDLSACYQKGSPTARDNSDILDTDGGFIRISGANNVVGMASTVGSLFVFSDNGVWEVKGGNDYGFSATNYSVSQLSTYGCVNKSTIVAVNDRIFYFSDDGLCVISRNQFGDWAVQNISEGTIQSLYKDIGIRELMISSGVYDLDTKTVRWLYRDNVETGQFKQKHTYELIFDLTLGSFTKNRIYNLDSDVYSGDPLRYAPPTILDYLPHSGFYSVDITDPVLRSVDLVFSDAEQVIITVKTVKVEKQKLKFLVLEDTQLSVDPDDGITKSYFQYTFAEYNNPAFVDWQTPFDNNTDETYTGDPPYDAHAYILTGTITAKDSAVFKQTPYLVMHFNKTEEIIDPEADNKLSYSQSSCFIRSQWDWATDTKTGKWSPLFQAYRYRRPYFSDGTEFENGYSVTTSKNKLRGRGRALSIYMETEANRDCHILGWNLSITGNSLA